MMPWKVKKYMDEVYTYGHGKLYETMDVLVMIQANNMVAGIVAGKQYMISVTWNAPIELSMNLVISLMGEG